MSKLPGVFMISLDLELYWGVRDKRKLEAYEDNLLGVHFAVPALLKLFAEYDVHATWAVVGFLFYETKEKLAENCPVDRPNYVNRELNPYPHLKNIGKNAQEDLFHYAPSLIKLIQSYPAQEIGSHTFSHYYCLEQGQDTYTFKSDLAAAKKAALDYGITIESLVFPRNQCNSAYLSVCRELGITAFRGDQSSWIYKTRKKYDETLLRRALRLIDTYINISGHHCHSLKNISNSYPFNIPSSRFLRPYSNRLKLFEPFRLNRIISGMTHAARTGQVFHLWWHPHNFGLNLNRNLVFLREILDHFKLLKRDYNMRSFNMNELVGFLSGEYRQEYSGKEGIL